VAEDFPCYLKIVPCYRVIRSLLFEERFRAKKSTKAQQNRHFVIAGRSETSLNRESSPYFSLLRGDGGEKFERTGCSGTNSNLHFEAEVEVSHLEIETERRKARIFPDPGVSVCKRRLDTRAIPPEWGRLDEQF
jgi:hypothetical protein